MLHLAPHQALVAGEESHNKEAKHHEGVDHSDSLALEETELATSSGSLLNGKHGLGEKGGERGGGSETSRVLGAADPGEGGRRVRQGRTRLSKIGLACGQ